MLANSVTGDVRAADHRAPAQQADRATRGTAVAKAMVSFDLPVIRTLGKSFCRQRLIDSGAAANASGLARRFKLEVRWVAVPTRQSQNTTTDFHPGVIDSII